VADCICVSFEEPQFFVSTKNIIRKVLIDPNPGTKCLVSKQKHNFSPQMDEIKATAMAYTVLKGSGGFVDVSTGESEAYIGVATSELSFVILRLTKRTQQEIV
jgi:hypothetical protein